MKNTVIDYIINRLADLGIEHAFGVPGDYSFPVDDAIEFSGRMKVGGLCQRIECFVCGRGLRQASRTS